MPKGHGGVDDHAKVKLRVIDFELEGANASVENSIRQLASALTPFRGTPLQRPVSSAKQSKELPAPEMDTEPEEISDAEVIDTEAQAGEAKPRTSTAKSKGVPRQPNYLHDLDVAGHGTSWKDFATAKAPKKDTTRYLVAAFWLKDHGNSPTITPDKVYTLYKYAGWPLSISDWDANFRGLVKRNRFRRVEAGEYAITPLGEGDLQKLNGAA